MKHAFFAVALAMMTVSFALVPGCGDGTGACVATGGLLLSPECKEEWTQSECTEWDDEGVNGSTWSFNSNTACSELGYTEECSDGSFRLPGAC